MCGIKSNKWNGKKGVKKTGSRVETSKNDWQTGRNK